MTEASGMMSLLAALLIGAAVFAFSRGIARARYEYTRSRRRLEGLAVRDDAAAAEAALRSRRRASSGSRLQSDLRRAGLAWTPTDYVVISVLTGALFGAIAFAATGIAVVAGPIAILACTIPTLIVRGRAGARGGRFNAQVVDTIELVASSLRSGFGFMQSLELASREQPSPMGDELRQLIREVDLGMSVDDALERLVARSHDQDLELVVQAVLVQRRVGGDLGDILTRIAGMIRDRIRVRGEIRMLTAQARMSGWIVGILPIVLAGVTWMIQPGQMMVLFTEPLGQLLVGAAVVLQIAGFVVIRRIAAVTY